MECLGIVVLILEYILHTAYSAFEIVVFCCYALEMSINRITTAPLNNILEIAPALATVNFDFSLWKVEAPKEFNGVGSALSSDRRDEAENGLLHATAQKLGALLDTLVPPAPNAVLVFMV